MLHDSRLRNKIIVAIAISLILIFLGFYKVFSGQIILPQTFSLGFLTIHYYGLTMAMAVAVAFYLAIKRSTNYNINKKQAEDLIFWLIIGGFIGARLYHVFSSFDYYLQNPQNIIKVWNGGLSIYGAVIGGLITLWICKRLLTFNFQLSTVLDWLTPSLVLGQIIGRLGNFFNYEAFGYPTNLPWKMFVPPQFRPENFQFINFFHPFFLYEILGNLLIFWLLMKILYPKLRLFARRPKSEDDKSSSDFAKASTGKLFFYYVLLYNLLRFGLESLRIDSTFIHGFRLNAVVSLVLVISSAGIVLVYKKRFMNIKEIR